jgi:hypothetical protein
VKYLVEEFTKAGATTTTKQTVPLVKITPQSLSDLKLSVGDKRCVEIKFGVVLE